MYIDRQRLVASGRQYSMSMLQRWERCGERCGLLDAEERALRARSTRGVSAERCWGALTAVALSERAWTRRFER